MTTNYEPKSNNGHSGTISDFEAVYNPAYSLEQDMPPSRDDRLFDLLERRFDEDRRLAADDRRLADDRHKQLIEAMAGGKQGKGFQERAAQWFPTILTMLVLGVTVIRFDTTRETKTSGEVAELRYRLEQMEKANEKLSDQLRMQERIWSSLNGEIEALLKKGK